MPSEEELLLLFKQSGVELIEEAGKAVGDLGDKMDAANATQAAAIEVLKEESTVLSDLKETINRLKLERESLTDKYLAGIITEEKYNELSKDSDRSLKEKEGTLKRVEASVQAQITKQQELADELIRDAAAAKGFQDSLLPMTMAADGAAVALPSVTKAAADVEGKGDGEDATGGLKGIAGAAVKAEKAIGKLASGHGLNSLPGLLESVGAAVGLGGGVGLAAGGLILAFESIIPKIEAFIEKVTGAAAAAKRAAEEMEAAHAQMAKFMKEPTGEEEESAKAVKEAIKGKQKFIAQGVEQSLIAEGYGGIDQEKLARLRTFLGPGKMLDDLMEENRKQIAQASAHRRTEIMNDLLAGKQGAIADVEGMTIRHQGLFPTGTEQRLRRTLPENIDAAKEQAQKAKADSEWADTIYAKQEAARKESEAIDLQFDKARKDKNKKAADDYDASMKFAADYKADLDNKAIVAEKHAQTQAEHNAKKAKADADKAQRAREKWDREHTFEHLTQAQEKAEGEAIMGVEWNQNQFRANMGAMPFDARELEAIKHKAMQAMPYYKARGFSVGQLVADMMAMQANEIEQGLTEGMGHHTRSGQLVNPQGGH